MLSCWAGVVWAWIVMLVLKTRGLKALHCGAYGSGSQQRQSAAWQSIELVINDRNEWQGGGLGAAGSSLLP